MIEVANINISRLTYPAPVPPSSPIQPAPAIQFADGPLALFVTHKLHAVFPSPAADYTADPLDLNRYLVDRVACIFLFDAAGRGMSGAHIVEGYKMVVDRSISPQRGHIVVAIVNAEFTIKRLRAAPRESGFPPDPPRRWRGAGSLRRAGRRGQEGAVSTQQPNLAGFAMVDVNNFYVSCERVLNPKLRARPVVVLSNRDLIGKSCYKKCLAK